MTFISAPQASQQQLLMAAEERGEYVYNHIRPHRSLDYLTPYEYYQQWLLNHRNNVSLTH